MRTVNKSSGIKGVTFCSKNGGKNKYWKARVQGRLNISKLFPYTESGKKKAAKFYQKVIKENKEKYYNYKLRFELQ